MAIPFLSDIERLITEHGSSSILKERLELLKDKAVLLERENAQLKQANAKLGERVNALESQLALQTRLEQYEEHRGALFKRRPGGGYHDAVYCPRCQSGASPFPPGEQYSCTLKGCGWFSSFTETDIDRVMRGLPT